MVKQVFKTFDDEIFETEEDAINHETKSFKEITEEYFRNYPNTLDTYGKYMCSSGMYSDFRILGFYEQTLRKVIEHCVMEHYNKYDNLVWEEITFKHL